MKYTKRHAIIRFLYNDHISLPVMGKLSLMEIVGTFAIIAATVLAILG